MDHLEEHQDVIWALSKERIFKDMPEQVLLALARRAKPVSFIQGDMVVKEGEEGQCMYMILSGEVHLQVEDFDLDTLGTWEIFGQIGLYGASRHIYSAVVDCPAELLCFERQDFHTIVEDDPAFYSILVRNLIDLMNDAFKDIFSLRLRMEKNILPLGIAMSQEGNFEHLLERMLLEAKKLCNADAGTLYLRTDDNRLAFKFMFTDSLGIALGGSHGGQIDFEPLPIFDPVTGLPNTHNLASYVASTGLAIQIPDVYHATHFDFSGTKAFDRMTGYRSISSLTVPLKNYEGKVIGVLQLWNALDPDTGMIKPFNEFHKLVVESLTSQAAMVLNTQNLLLKQEQYVKLEQDMKTGREIQAGFLPLNLPQLPGYQTAGLLDPAREVAGDFYDIFNLADEGRLALIIGDVCDKGVGAALFMALFRSLLHAFAEQHYQEQNLQLLGIGASVPGDMRTTKLTRSVGATALNNAILQTNSYIARQHADANMFATVFFGVLDLPSDRLYYINAGHEAPILIGADGKVKRSLNPTGPALGVFADAHFGIESIYLEPGDVLFAYTDGVPDAKNATGVKFGKPRMKELLDQPVSSARELLDRIYIRLNEHLLESLQFDDITMIALRRTN